MGVCAVFYMYVLVVKSSRSLSHLLMSSCLSLTAQIEKKVSRYPNSADFSDRLSVLQSVGVSVNDRDVATFRQWSVLSVKLFTFHDR